MLVYQRVYPNEIIHLPTSKSTISMWSASVIFTHQGAHAGSALEALEATVGSGVQSTRGATLKHQKSMAPGVGLDVDFTLW